MASIKDAFEESLQDNNAILKYILFGIPVYFSIQFFIEDKMGLFWTIATITFLILFGFLIKCTDNVRNGASQLLPSLNIFKLFFLGLKGTIAIGPLIFVNTWLANYINGFVTTYIPEPNTAIIFKVIIWGICCSIILTGFMCYSYSFKIKDAYNFKVISESCFDILLAIIFMIPQILIANAIIIVPATYVIWVFLGIPHPVAYYFWSVAFIFNLAMCGHYLAQINYEIVGTDIRQKEEDENFKNSMSNMDKF